MKTYFVTKKLPKQLCACTLCLVSHSMTHSWVLPNTFPLVGRQLKVLHSESVQLQLPDIQCLLSREYFMSLICPAIFVLI
ncbi:hypothetical protein EB796_008444 [Bugula neritina]|uniref:Uncharacterized protein n=1 Tax=Bugula neritina TaxID=10212 RepID=A0A7J7K3P5_BUGNE|nr:hypothetical protein EB796_008444 [Bugula neritina]